MSSASRVIVVGAGQAGGEFAAGLRENGFRGQVTLIGDESLHPYHRPPLSKGYLSGEKNAGDLLVRSVDTYQRHDISVRTGQSVRRIDRTRKVAILADGSAAEYDVLVLATGGSARRHPDMRLDSAPNVHYLRSLNDADRLRTQLVPRQRLVVIGGGYIGLEIASVAASLGMHVSVIERERRLLARVASPEISEFFHRLHTGRGVEVRANTAIEDVKTRQGGRITAIALGDGTVLEVNVCLVAIGLQPNVGLAEASGLAVDDGIVVDSELRTNDPSIFALGDVARHPCPERGGLRRLESIANATEQARWLAAKLCGVDVTEPAVPWFWSDQFDVKYQSAGLRDPDDEVVVRGQLIPGEKATVFYLRGGEVRSADVLSNPAEFALAKKLVAKRARVCVSDLQNRELSLRSLLQRA